MAVDASGFFPSRHVASQLVGFSGCVVGGNDSKPHDLFLEQGHSVGLLEYRAQGRVRVLDRLFSVPTTQVGMNHAAAYRSRPNDADFDNQVVKGFRS